MIQRANSETMHRRKKKVFYMPRPWGHRIMHGLCVAEQALLSDVWFGEYTYGVALKAKNDKSICFCLFDLGFRPKGSRCMLTWRPTQNSPNSGMCLGSFVGSTLMHETP